jgi:ubiquinone/menaquinone biosynthesis C-methylase UbiE
MALILKRCPAQLAFMLEHPLRRRLLKVDKLVESLRLSPGARVLDVGAGSGVVSSEVAKQLPRGEIILIDPQPKMLQRARKRIPSRPSVAVYFAAAVAEHLPLADQSVDAALLVTVLGEVDDATLVLREIHRVLKPGGVFSVSEHLPDPDFRAANKVRALTNAGGFTERDTFGGRWSYTINFVTKQR